MTAAVKASLTLTLLAFVGFAVSGCGATKKIVLHVDTANRITLAASTTVTISNAKTGTLIKCRGGAGAKVPPPGVLIAGPDPRVVGAPDAIPSRFGEIDLTHLRNGLVTVTCKKRH